MPRLFSAVSGRWRALILGAGVLALAVAFLSPMLKSGFCGDDAINSLVMPTLDSGSWSIVTRTISEQAVAWATLQGRFFLLAYVAYGMFYLINGNVLVYKILVMALVLADIGLFGLLIKRLSGSVGAGMFGAAVVLLAMQMRAFHDPILGFSTLLQMSLLWILVSLLAFTTYLQTGKSRHLLLSAAAYLLATLTYEVTLPLFLIHVIVAWLFPGRQRFGVALRRSWPFVAIAAASVLGVILLRSVYGVSLGGAGGSTYMPNADPLAFLTTLAKQTAGAFPLSYHALDAFSTSAIHPSPGLFENLAVYARRYPVSTLAVLTGFVLVVSAAIRRVGSDVRDDSHPARAGLIAAVGLALLVLPGTLISLSPRWQTELFWGISYLPVYISYFGVATLAVALLLAVAESRPRWLMRWAGLTLALLVALVGTTTYHDNRMVIDAWNDGWKFPREAEMAGLRAGTLDALRDGATVVVGTPHSWDVPMFFEVYTGRAPGAVVQAVGTGFEAPGGALSEQVTDSGTVYDYGPTSTVYYISYGSTDPAAGFAFAGRAESLVVEDGRLSSVRVTGGRLYRWANGASEGFEAPAIRGRPRLIGDFDPGTLLGVGPGALEPVATGEDWTLEAITADVNLVL